MSRTLVLEGQWLANLEQQIEDSDYCYLCDNHPSHGHDKNCPIATNIEDTDDGVRGASMRGHYDAGPAVRYDPDIGAFRAYLPDDGGG